MKTKAAILCLLTVGLVSTALAQEGEVPKGIPRLDHVFVIMMENHAYNQVVGNPNLPFINTYAKSLNSAHNYFAVGHPSLTNYLEIVGGSNFGIRNDCVESEYCRNDDRRRARSRQHDLDRS